MKRIWFIVLAALAMCVTLASCTKSDGKVDIKDVLKGTWYVSTVEQHNNKGTDEYNPDYETYDQCHGEHYWTFKSGKVTLTQYPQSPHSANKASYSYEEGDECWILTVDGVFKYEIVSMTSSSMTLISHFPPEVWDRKSYLAIDLVRNKKHLK